MRVATRRPHGEGARSFSGRRSDSGRVPAGGQVSGHRDGAPWGWGMGPSQPRKPGVHGWPCNPAQPLQRHVSWGFEEEGVQQRPRQTRAPPTASRAQREAESGIGGCGFTHAPLCLLPGPWVPHPSRCRSTGRGGAGGRWRAGSVPLTPPRTWRPALVRTSLTPRGPSGERNHVKAHTPTAVSSARIDLIFRHGSAGRGPPGVQPGPPQRPASPALCPLRGPAGPRGLAMAPSLCRRDSRGPGGTQQPLSWTDFPSLEARRGHRGPSSWERRANRRSHGGLRARSGPKQFTALQNPSIHSFRVLPEGPSRSPRSIPEAGCLPRRRRERDAASRATPGGGARRRASSSGPAAGGCGTGGRAYPTPGVSQAAGRTPRTTARLDVNGDQSVT